jgi:hypothetical protein
MTNRFWIDDGRVAPLEVLLDLLVVLGLLPDGRLHRDQVVGGVFGRAARLQHLGRTVHAEAVEDLVGDGGFDVDAVEALAELLGRLHQLVVVAVGAHRGGQQTLPRAGLPAHHVQLDCNKE